METNHSEKSLSELVEQYGITFKATFKGESEAEPDSSGRRWRRNDYSVTLKMGQKTLRTKFFTGFAHKSPTAVDVLYCLISDAQVGVDTFEDFCSNFGFDTDSRKDHAIWQKCRKMAPKVRKFLGEHFEEFEAAAGRF
jgi:hypothetical protein